MQSAHSSIYSMLLTLLFYTTASVCALRAAAWLSLHALLPALSRLLSHCYTHYLHSEGTSRHGGIPSSSSSLGGSGTLFKLVRTAAGHVLFVPVSISDPGQANSELGTASESIPTPLRRHATLALWFTSFLGTILIAYYPYYYIQAVINSARQSRRRSSTINTTSPADPDSNSNSNNIPIPRTPPSPTRRAPAKTAWPDTHSDSEKGPATPASETRTNTRRLNPAAPVFTPSLAHHRRRLRPLPDHPTTTTLTRAFPFGPPSPADSPGPATPLGPSHVRGAFTFALAARATRGSKGDIHGSPLPFPLGLEKTRVVQPEDLIVGVQGTDNVF